MKHPPRPHRAAVQRACVGALAVAFCTSAGAQAPGAIARLAPAGPAVEIIDPEERISGNAATGIVIVREGDRIGRDRLWAYLSEPVAERLTLSISSIDGRYYAELEYDTDGGAVGWVALDLPLDEFGFLEDNYDEPLREIAALLSDAESPRFYPVRWGAPHAGRATPPPLPADDDPLRVYMNTERAAAFVVVDGSPAYCGDASAMSRFKFNAICEMQLKHVRREEPEDGRRIVDAIEVFRRAGVRALDPLKLDVAIQY